jgi:hypothetical protein
MAIGYTEFKSVEDGLTNKNYGTIIIFNALWISSNWESVEKHFLLQNGMVLLSA